MRSPLTIASGYLEVLMARHHDAETTDDLSVIHEELARLNRACDRLIRSLRVEQPLAVTAVDVDALVAETVHRWTPVADRSWLVAARAGVVDGSAERLRACLDTLVENAIRYTSCGGTIEVYARRESDQLVVGVADSGPGFSDQFIEAVTDAHSLDVVDGARDDLSQTGLGIGLVVDVARLRGGQVVVGRSAHGGADIALRVPVHPPQSTPWSPGLERRVVPRGLVTS
jgi:signal transduction histidine kinase